jgi:hypothetical protein
MNRVSRFTGPSIKRIVLLASNDCVGVGRRRGDGGLGAGTAQATPGTHRRLTTQVRFA